ncbi:MAG: DNA-directed RNA polymerase specialized sigma24 family protein [Acidimicrobiales bacterium]|jgi:DNA-directed RNA polymerase specialized sigma24 family protein
MMWSPRLDTVDEMAELLLGLPVRQRAALVLRFYGGQSEADIANHLDCRPGTSGSLIHRGLKTLRATLEQNEGKQAR